MAPFIVLENNRILKYEKEELVLPIIKALLTLNHQFEVVIPKAADDFAKELDKIANELDMQVEIDRGSDPKAVEYFLFGLAGAGIGAAQFSLLAAGIWKGCVAALATYKDAGGASDLVLPGFGTVIAIGAGVGVATGIASGLLLAKWRIKITVSKPFNLSSAVYEKNSITLSFQPI